MLPKVNTRLSKCKQRFHMTLQAGLCKLFNKQTVTTGDVVIKSFKIGLPIVFVLTVCLMIGTIVLVFLEIILPIPESIMNILNSFVGWQAFLFLILFGALVISGTLFGFNIIMSKTGKKLLSSVLLKLKSKLSLFRVLIYSRNIVTCTIKIVKHLAEFKLAEAPKRGP